MLWGSHWRLAKSLGPGADTFKPISASAAAEGSHPGNGLVIRPAYPVRSKVDGDPTRRVVRGDSLHNLPASLVDLLVSAASSRIA